MATRYCIKYQAILNKEIEEAVCTFRILFGPLRFILFLFFDLLYFPMNLLDCKCFE